MNREVLILTHSHTIEKRILVRKKVIDFWVKREEKVVVFHEEDISFGDNSKTILRKTKKHVDGYNEIYKYLYGSDLDYALIIDDDTIINEEDSTGDLFQSFEDNFDKMDVLSPILGNSYYKNKVKLGGFENQYAFCARINIFKNFKKHLGFEIYCESDLVRRSDTEFGVQMLIKGLVLKRLRSVVEKTLCHTLSSIEFDKKDKSIYKKEIEIIAKKYGIRLMKFKSKDTKKLDLKNFIKNLKTKNQKHLF